MIIKEHQQVWSIYLFEKKAEAEAKSSVKEFH